VSAGATDVRAVPARVGPAAALVAGGSSLTRAAPATWFPALAADLAHGLRLPDDRITDAR
jgi:hypothetical protein